MEIDVLMRELDFIHVVMRNWAALIIWCRIVDH